MMWVQTIFPLVLGLVLVGPWQDAKAAKSFNLKVKNFTYGRPGDKPNSSEMSQLLVDNRLYMKYACQNKQNGLRMPIEGTCTEYFECQQGVTKLMACKEGKHFSTFGLACIDASLSKCSVKCEGLCCGKEDGLHPDVTDCGKFIICVNQEAHQQSCGSVFKFNAEKLMCDIPERARCTETSNKPFINRNIESQPNIKKPIMYMVSHKMCRGKSTGSSVGILGSCNKFYLCINDIGYLKSCGNMQFNVEGSFCDTRTRIFCPEFEEDDVILDEDEYPRVDKVPKPWLRPSKPVIPQIRPTPNETDKKPQQTPAVQDEEKNHFWEFWKPKPGNHPENVEEPQPPHRVPGKPFPKNKLPNVENEIRPPVAGNIELPHWEHKPTPMPNLPEKPENLPYRPPNQGPPLIPKPPVIPTVPVPPNVVDPNTVVEEIIDPKKYASLCSNQSVGAIIALPKNCHKYIYCKWDWVEGRVAEVKACPMNLHFNAKTKACGLPQEAGCVFNL